MLSTLLEQDNARGHKTESRILDLRHVDVKLCCHDVLIKTDSNGK